MVSVVLHPISLTADRTSEAETHAWPFWAGGAARCLRRLLASVKTDCSSVTVNLVSWAPLRVMTRLTSLVVAGTFRIWTMIASPWKLTILLAGTGLIAMVLEVFYAVWAQARLSRVFEVTPVVSLTTRAAKDRLSGLRLRTVPNRRALGPGLCFGFHMMMHTGVVSVFEAYTPGCAGVKGVSHAMMR